MRRTSGPWLMLLLAVLVPSVCLLWFMSQAVRNERLATRQKLTEAYQGYLSLVQEHLDRKWREQADALDAGLDEGPASSRFAHEVRAGLADAVVLFDADGDVLYPDPTLPPVESVPAGDWAEASRLEWTDAARAADVYAGLAEQATNANQAAQALQGQLRCLIRAGDQARAISLVTGPLADGRFHNATNTQGRLIVPATQLIALGLLKDPSSSVAERLRQQLEQRLLDYENSFFPAAQRRFLMQELQRLFPETGVSTMLAAEDLAANVVEAGLQPSSKLGLSAGPIPGVWQFPSASGRVMALFKTETLESLVLGERQMTALPDGVRMHFLASGEEPGGTLATVSAGALFPGWRLGLAVEDSALLEAATQQRITGYLWTGALAVAIVIALAVLAWGMFRRQAALSQLRNDLVANVTHELKTPLSSMRLLVDTLRESPRLHEPTAREYLDLIAAENLRLSRLIENFLTFSRIERNKYRFDFHPVEPGRIARNAIAAVSERFNVPGCSFEATIAPTLPRIIADADALVMALINLLDNAWKYSNAEKRIAFSVVAENGAVRFKVADNGIGLSPRDARRIFTRFYRVEPREAKAGGGCGLGLSIVNFIVTAHRGTVDVESKPNHGSIFTISVPAEPVDHPQGTRP